MVKFYVYPRLNLKTNQFQKKLTVQNTNDIWICPPHLYRRGYATGCIDIAVPV